LVEKRGLEKAVVWRGGTTKGRNRKLTAYNRDEPGGDSKNIRKGGMPSDPAREGNIGGGESRKVAGDLMRNKRGKR